MIECRIEKNQIVLIVRSQSQLMQKDARFAMAEHMSESILAAGLEVLRLICQSIKNNTILRTGLDKEIDGAKSILCVEHKFYSIMAEKFLNVLAVVKNIGNFSLLTISTAAVENIIERLKRACIYGQSKTNFLPFFKFFATTVTRLKDSMQYVLTKINEFAWKFSDDLYTLTPKEWEELRPGVHMN